MAILTPPENKLSSFKLATYSRSRVKTYGAFCYLRHVFGKTRRGCEGLAYRQNGMLIATGRRVLPKAASNDDQLGDVRMFFERGLNYWFGEFQHSPIIPGKET